jgi:hypothetical protein
MIRLGRKGLHEYRPEQVADAVAQLPPREVASFLERLGMSLELQGQAGTGQTLRGFAREIRDELSETAHMIPPSLRGQA